MTRQRAQIFQVIMESPRHMTADEIFETARVQMPGLARATVYRNLGLMVRDGQVRRVRIAGEPDRFDRVVEAHEHIHCPRCGSLEDLRVPWIRERLENELKMVSYHLTKGEQLESVLQQTFKEIEDIADVHQMTNAQLKRIIQKIEVDKDGNVDIYLRLFGDLGLDETVLIRNVQT